MVKGTETGNRVAGWGLDALSAAYMQMVCQRTCNFANKAEQQAMPVKGVRATSMATTL